MHVLLVEDEAPKLEKLLDFLKENYSDFEMEVAKSVRARWISCVKMSLLISLFLICHCLPSTFRSARVEARRKDLAG